MDIGCPMRKKKLQSFISNSRHMDRYILEGNGFSLKKVSNVWKPCSICALLSARLICRCIFELIYKIRFEMWYNNICSAWRYLTSCACVAEYGIFLHIREIYINNVSPYSCYPLKSCIYAKAPSVKNHHNTCVETSRC